MQLVVGRIGRAHGISGQVSVDVRTDAVDERFAPGTIVTTDPPERGPLTVASARWHSGRLLVAFDGVEDRNAAEQLRGTLLVADSDTSPDGDDDEWWDHQIVGLTVETVEGVIVGTVGEIAHLPGSDVIVVGRTRGADLLVPFVAEIVPLVDVDGGRIVIDPPPGLLEL